MAMKDTRNHGALRSHNADYKITSGFLAAESAQSLFIELLESIPWQPETVRMFGRRIESRRRGAFFGSIPLIYGYSGIRHQSLPMPPVLGDLLTLVRQGTGVDFNSLLATLYPDGNTSLGWHQDDEPELGPR